MLNSLHLHRFGSVGLHREHSGRGPQPVCRAGDALWSSIQNMRVNLGGFQIFVSKEFLHRANVRARDQQGGGERVP